ncbi:Alpha/Beta hydrolase protein [Elsinoe ampelina]|uniref:Alpha/Beta hydrolase protein n=1 Tax=Elsinoe ampelina TaxID=302913 RepID=A0A6A6FZS2_9PEZI|nr:Alpha/Beta hydrolase protein [Elsinoe ampelina]
MGGVKPTIPDGVAFEILSIPGPHGQQVRIHHFKTKAQSGPSAAVIHFHGGGFITLSADINTQRLAGIVLETGVQVFSVDYRLAPEHPYPAAFNDGCATLAWIHKNASILNVDLARIAILCSPMLDDRTTGDVPGDFKLWDEEDNLTGWTAYLGKPPEGDNVPATAAPARVRDVAGLPPLYLDTSQFDLFVRENLRYVQRFVDAGIEVESHVHPGLPHGFDALLPTHSVTMAYEKNRQRILKKL